ncbi:MAG: AtpZ/AtpI family protein [Nocardioides sp.]
MADERPHSATENAASENPLRGRDLVGLGGLLAGSVIFCTVLGLVIDRQAGTAPAWTLVGVGAGIVFGAVGFWLRVRSALRG